jgi:hypothetical protein
MVFPKIGTNGFRAAGAIVLLSLGILILGGCQKDTSHPRSYPEVRTNLVSEITEKGATFSANILSIGSETITEHGFVWSEGKEPNLTYDRINLGPTDTTGVYTAEIKAALGKNVNYTVKAYLKTNEHIVYGDPRQFVSLGSDAPVVRGFSPDSAQWLDTLTIKGKNFSWNNRVTTVKLNQTECPLISLTDTSVTVYISKDLPDVKSVISVDVSGNRSVFIQDTFRLIAPRITSITPSVAAWRAEVTISGEHFQAKNLVNIISASIGALPANILSKTANSVTVMVPENVSSVNNDMNLKFNNLVVTAHSGFTLKTPEISHIIPASGTWRSIITLVGKFHPVKDKNSITIGGFDAEIISNSADTIKVIAPYYLVDHKNPVKNSISPFEVVSKDTFNLFAPVLDSITPLKGSTATQVVIYGKYLSGGYPTPTVKFSNTESPYPYTGDNIIACYVPPDMPNGPVNLSVTLGNQTAVFKSQFVVQNPIVTGSTPSTGTFDDQITIQGSNLLVDGYSPEIYIGSYERGMYAPVVSATASSITATVPRYMDSIPGNIVLRYFNKGFSINTTASFVLTPPVITSVTPATLIPGQTITISGNNFNPDANRNLVSWSSIPFTVTSSSKTSITALVPDYLPKGSDQIRLNMAGFKRRSAESLSYSNSAWTIIHVPSDFEWSAYDQIGQSGISFATGGKGYIMDYYGNMNSFNPATGLFTKVGNYPEVGQQYAARCVTINDTVIYLAGSLGFLRFDVPSAKWIKMGSLPTSMTGYTYAFKINGRLFFGGNTENWTRFLWEYQSSTKTWITKTENTFRFNPYTVGSFVYNNKGYVLFLDNVLSSYDPETNTWTDMAPFPGPSVDGRSAFMINDKFYVGLGPGLTDLYYYDPSTDTWTQISPMPGLGRYNNAAFGINGKAYVGFGFTSPSGYGTVKMNDFYEFDPNYSSK